jgi:hypothetical protein
MTTINNEHCPTCDGTHFVKRGDRNVACPTCSPRTQQIGLHVADVDEGSGRAAYVWRGMMLLVTAALLVGAIVLMAR